MSLDDLQAQLRGALDQQFAALKQHYEGAIDEARRHSAAQATSEAERRFAETLATQQAEFSGKLDAVQAEFATRLETEVAATRADVDRLAREKLHAMQAEFKSRLESDVAAARADTEMHALAQLHAMQTDFLKRRENDVAAARTKALQQAAEQQAEFEQRLQQQFAEQMEQALASARSAAELEIDAERRRAAEVLDAERQRTLGELEAARQGAAEIDAEQRRSRAELDTHRDRAAQLEAAHQRARAELDAERERMAQLEAEHQRARTELDAQRERAAQIDAEHERARAELDSHRGRASQLETEHQRARSELDAERQRVAEIDAKRQESEAALATARQQAEAQVQAERQRAQQEIQAERERATAALDAERRSAATDMDALRTRMETDLASALAAASSVGSSLSASSFDRVAGAMRVLDGAHTLGQALESLLNQAGTIAGRAALFLISADRLKPWKAVGIPDVDVQTVESSIGGKDLLARAIQLGRTMPSGTELPAPPFARLPADRTGVAAPIMIGGRPVAVLYADGGTTHPSPEGIAAAIDMLVRHASAVIALRTAMRTLDVVNGGPLDGSGNIDGAADDGSDDQGARRYARLLVSEIKLYNEAAVRAGRQQRDLLRRLRPEIDRAQKLYEERVPVAVGSRHLYFQQELVQTLADGDPGLLGNA